MQHVAYLLHLKLIKVLITLIILRFHQATRSMKVYFCIYVQEILHKQVQKKRKIFIANSHLNSFIPILLSKDKTFMVLSMNYPLKLLQMSLKNDFSILSKIKTSLRSMQQDL